MHADFKCLEIFGEHLHSNDTSFIKSLKGLVHPKMKMILLFTPPQATLGVYDFLLSDESIRSYIKNHPGSSKLYCCSQ